MYLLLLAIMGAASAALAVVAWPHRRHRGFGHFVVLEAATAWWIFCYLGEQLDAPHAAVWFAAKFPAIGLIPPSWLLFTLHHIGRPPRLVAISVKNQRCQSLVNVSGPSTSGQRYTSRHRHDRGGRPM